MLRILAISAIFLVGPAFAPAHALIVGLTVTEPAIVLYVDEAKAVTVL